MVKCAAFKCTSGYKPKKHEEEMLKRGETPPCKKSVFRIPKDPEIRLKWIAAICRKDKDFNPDCAGVCQLHFKAEDFDESIAPRTKTERLRLRLKATAVPSVFDEYPVTASPETVEERKTNLSLASACRIEAQDILDDKTHPFFNEEKLSDLEDLFSKLSNEQLPSGFRPVMMCLADGSNVLSVRIETLDAVTSSPIIRCNITIFANLTYVMHANGKHLSSTKVSDLTSNSGKFCTLNEVLNVLARLKGLVADTKDYLLQAASILEALVEQSPHNEIRPLATFAAEQLRLISKPQHGRRYSSFLLDNAVIWDRTSPKMYEMLQRCSFFCLPHSKTLRRLTSASEVMSGLDNLTVTYLRMRLNRLDPREFHSIDRIHSSVTSLSQKLSVERRNVCLSRNVSVSQ